MPVETEEEILTAARALIAKGMGAVIVTLGSRGALLVTPTESRRIEPISVTPVDTTGAGDAFVGSFARYFAAGLKPEDALAKAARYAADSATRRRPRRPMPRKAEFEGFCESLQAPDAFP